MPRTATPFAEMYIVADSGCWEWIRFKNPGGYGQMYRGRTTIMAPRFSWALVNGPIPDGLTVDHLCFNPGCVNPDHLRLLTRSQNSANKRSALSSTCLWGHEFTPENTGRHPKGGRMCCACARRRAAEQHARKRAAA